VDVRLGTTPVAAVHLGGEKVWPTGPGFHPTDIPGCALWLDADDQATIQSTGGRVTRWADRSNSHYDFTQPTPASAPTIGTQDGRGTITFDGNSYIAWWDATSINLAHMTVFVVCEQTAEGGAAGVICGFPPTGSDWDRPDAFAMSTADTSRFMEFGSAGPQNFVVLIGEGLAPPSVFVGVLGGTPDTSLIRDGSERQSASTVAGRTMATGLIIGARTQNSRAIFNYFTGWIGEVIIYDTALSDSDINTVGQYLADKWGTTWAPL
jgi:hypothetical protein